MGVAAGWWLGRGGGCGAVVVGGGGRVVAGGLKDVKNARVSVGVSWRKRGVRFLRKPTCQNARRVRRRKRGVSISRKPELTTKGCPLNTLTHSHIIYICY